ncbi:bifunctional Mu homology domain/Longin-like domain superfamily/AP-2 complex subunit mu [Babesia duncani]|uniref:Bifunctional Mu homology domain/Longin-like domain superfamily/AP-2 complex subunit mu n=1 Tax=Babesia duncani TaxID=323732 RepID=A0AAD9PIG6_9APIC|nr:bifunctional Mu homology domain/Longin-like domain superfamily/AP-2 complex subunit mu [Babesia duncani]
MTLSQFFAISACGDVILSRNLRGEENSGMCIFKTIKFQGDPEVFYSCIREEFTDKPPIFQQNGVFFFYINRSGLYFVATSLYKMPPNYVLELLQRITQALKVCHKLKCLFQDFFGSLSEDSLRKNYALAYELLDEMLHYGYPQCTSTAELKKKVYNVAAAPTLHPLERLRSAGMRSKAVAPSYTSQRPISQASKNEIFVDVLERLTAILGPNGTVVNANIDGQIQIKSFLHNSPRVQLALNETIAIGQHGKQMGVPTLDFCTFDECVDLSKFDKSKIIEMAPPQGEFTAMTYRVWRNVPLPFKIVPSLDITAVKTRLVISIVSNMPQNLVANIKMTCGLPKGITDINVSSSQGGVYDHSLHQLKWDLIRIVGGSEARTKATIYHETQTLLNKRDFGPINLSFELPLYCPSGVLVILILEKNCTGSIPSSPSTRYAATNISMGTICCKDKLLYISLWLVFPITLHFTLQNHPYIHKLFSTFRLKPIGTYYESF